MKVITTIDEVRDQVKAWRNNGESIGLVPTMGYLHEGHQSLMASAKKDNQRVIVTIFVNPMQFGPKEDLASYPRDLERDKKACQQMGVDLIFCPSADEIYDANFNSYVNVNGLTDALCGKKRPGHFKGVCTVVTKLFNITQPDRAYFGQKDAQQLAVIQRMVQDFNIPIEIIGCPIVRESDGLAKSSRNSYLSDNERKAAVCLYQSIELANTMIAQGERSVATILSAMQLLIEQQSLAKIDYIEFVDLSSLKPVSQLTQDTLCALAVYIGKTRLIDNFIYHH
ncbi:MULTISPECIES: pantoate--beta-alanine ligase [unclassified Gilliamella]|uniref:pantoate--beta-alanine ligase n=1 Tax=unclassified Gilliamella TaxID=2685620 RepID=UPI002269B623|nr:MULTISPECIES: pantoate--beta-alanine ligase [unclassified Gilliamella]MCX8641760.1 pantoate--beta-alanine ligase [Gilliamella sp. B3835]MCX8706560.1 pantoate--beta-alanine ligase [Gilliamella sp. B3783]MCX8708970.1 pantoate--beta-alanine ligase [Gilliamella sp. B3780]MCX8714469.1 pantoate--beta-alanine ligase [Gilliamella sp. B3781]MCX8715836.1 pantoate--beta-alanine ligase [Gilliamella sp. B3784]